MYVSPSLKVAPSPLLSADLYQEFTRLWYFYQATTGNFRLVLDKLHRKYGPIVRITPHIVDIDMPELIKVIYNTKDDWLKTPFYHGSSALVNGQIVLNIFSQCDPVAHKRERQPIAKYFSNAGIALVEPHMDKVIKTLIKQLDERSIRGPNAGKPVNLGQWILYYTWDVVGAVSFSQPIGYLENGYDFGSTLSIADKAMDYFTAVGTIPFLDRLLDKNPVCRLGPAGFGTITGISIQHLVDRYQGKDKDYHDPSSPDFLDKFIEAKNASAEKVPDEQIISWLMVSMIAGADTTAITIRSALYFSLKNPSVWKGLTKEVLADGYQARIPPSYKDVKSLPYLDAVVREALRMLPGVSMTMERFVPRGGFSLPNGDYLPEGTIVSMNPYIVARNKALYGEDADEFHPERWLQDEANGESMESYQKRLLLMRWNEKLEQEPREKLDQCIRMT